MYPSKVLSISGEPVRERRQPYPKKKEKGGEASRLCRFLNRVWSFLSREELPEEGE